MNVKPKKHLGQHFLVDKNIATKIVGSLQLSNSNSLLEIGSGKGILSSLILDKGVKNFYVIDVDKESIDYLQSVFPQLYKNIIHGDFLRSDVLNKMEKPIAIIGNLPYNISSQIMFKILKYKDSISEIVCMVQKEVAHRYVSGPNSKTYGILSVLLQAFYNLEYLFTVSEKVFNPRPKVKSAVIRLKRKENIKLGCPEELFFKVVKTGFGKRRKTLKNSLKPLLGDKVANIDLLLKRPEQLNVIEFVHLTNFIAGL